MTLKELKPGQRGKVTGLGAEGAMKRRIMDMGVTPGVEIQVVKTAPLGDPVEVRVRGYELSLRKDEAALVNIEL
ncbi:MAG: ferrous iron transport protein A [Hungatella sp.]|nr:ferrous iron transport protein A [Hungatella sp.]